MSSLPVSLSDDPALAPRASREPVAVLMSRFPTVTETFILREMIEMERQAQPVRVVPMIRETPKVIHDAARQWIDRAMYTKWISLPIVTANLKMLVRRPLRYTALLARLIAGTISSPDVLARTLAVLPKSVFLAGQLEREGVRHIHAHYATHPSTMALIIASLSPVTFSFTVHAHDIQVNRALLRWKLRETRFVRSISDYNKRFLEKLYPAEAAGKITVIHVGIYPEIYEEKARQIRPDTSAAARVLCVAAHKPYKGLPYLIEACRMLRDDGVEVRCDIVGDGPMRAQLETMIRELRLEDVVNIAGARPEADVARLMAEATMFVLPSIVASDGQMEGIPVALMEAMATGRPVVSTRISGIPELVEDGVNGFLVEPENARALADAMKKIATGRELAETMGRRGQEKVRAEFSQRHCVAQLIARLDQEAKR